MLTAKTIQLSWKPIEEGRRIKLSKNYFAFEPSQNESICKLNSDGTYAVNNNSGSVYSETSDWVDFDGGSGTYYLKVEGVDFSELSYSSYVSVRFKSGSSEVSMYADRGMNPHSRQITNPSQIKFEMAFENGVSAPNLKVMLSNGESEWESAFGGSEPEPQNGTVNVVAYYQNPNGSWPGSPETIRSVQQEVGTTFYTTSDDRTPKKSPSSGEYVYDSSTSDQSVLVSSAATYTVELRFKLNFTVTYTDGVSGTQVFADQVYSGLEYGESTPSFFGTPSRSGYIFTGWSPSVKSTVTASQTYTAQWVVDSGESSGKVLARDKITLIHVDEHLDDIQNAQNTADEAAGNAAENEERISNAESSITQLADSITTLITDDDGNSMMEQTSDGWTFNISVITSSINDAKEVIENTSGDVEQLDQIVSNLDSLLNDISEKTAYINLTTDDTGRPCIELGRTDDPFKVRITNTSMDFMEDGSIIAYVSNKTLFIEKAIIKNEIQIGEGDGFVWKRRGNGNMGVRWVEGS